MIFFIPGILLLLLMAVITLGARRGRRVLDTRTNVRALEQTVLSSWSEYPEPFADAVARLALSKSEWLDDGIVSGFRSYTTAASNFTTIQKKLDVFELDMSPGARWEVDGPEDVSRISKAIIDWKRDMISAGHYP